MANTKKREDILYDYLENARTPFSLSDVFKKTGLKKTKKNEVEISEMIQSTEYFVLHKKKFHPRSSFLPKIPIRMSPTDFELERDILIPGHRMLPFHPFGFFMDDITFKYKNKVVKTIKKTFKMEELQIFFTLMDLQKFPIHNIEAILDEGADLEINVLDMKSFYKKNNFQLGDTIVARSSDFNKGYFTIEYVSLDDFHTNIFEAQRIDRLFWKTLKEVIGTPLIFPNIEKQLLYTYFILRNEPWGMPGTALGPLLGEKKEVAFSTLPNGRTVFHFPDQDFEDLDMYPNFEDYREDEDEELDFSTIDGILQYLNNNNDSVVVRAILLDMITENKRFSFAKIETYLFDGLPKPYMPAELRDLFKFMVSEEFKNLKKTFNPDFAFFPITTARKKILDELLHISRFLRWLDASMVKLEDLPKNEMIHLMELDRALVEVLYNLEVSQMEEQNSSQDVHRILKMVDRMGTELPNMFDLIKSKLK